MNHCSDRKPVLSTAGLAIGYRLSHGRTRELAAELEIGLVPGEVVCLIGPNGAGKSTLLRTLAGLHAPLSGDVLLGDTRIAEMTAAEISRFVSIVLTERVDAGMMSCFSLVALGRHPYTGWSGHLAEEDIRVVDRALSSVGASELGSAHMSRISDGERQKVMIARALAQESRIIILDEPTAYLDLPRRVEIMGLLRKLGRETGRSILLSTHDLDLALRSADRMWVLSQGGSLERGAPEDLVLSGAFEAAFQNHDVKFDSRHGSFTVAARSRGRIAVDARGLELIWTRRALEREGYRVGRSSTRVRVSTTEGVTLWSVESEEGDAVFSSIYDLVRYLGEDWKSREA